MGLKNGGLRSGGLRNASEISTIPDSVEIQYTGPTYTNGDSTWVDDATADGSQDMSLTGDPAETSFSDGAEGVDFDGGDDYGLVTFPSALSGSSLQSWSLEFAIQTTTSGENDLIGVINNSADQQILIRPNVDGSFNTSDGDMLVRIDDGADQRLQFGFSASLTDGNRHDVSIIFEDTATNDATVIVDGSTKTVNKVTAEGPGSGFDGWDRDVGIAVTNDDSGTIINHLDIGIAALRAHSTNISEQTIDSLP